MTTRSRARAASLPYQTLRSGPWKRVFTTADPYDGAPSDLVDGLNGYIPDPVNGSGFYARPGAVCLNHGNQLGEDGKRNVQGFYTHTDLTGVVTNFVVVGGHLYRDDPGGLTDVTPVGTTIDSSRQTRVYFASLTGTLVVSDGVVAPWIASNLSSTPITATPISFSTAAGTNWSAYGRPRIYGGALVCIINQVNGTSARASIAWSEPGDPSRGYQQTNFSNYWTLEQTQQGPAPLYALAPTEVAMYLFREGSITSFQGVVGPNLASDATTDTISVNIGALTAAGVEIFGNTIYFADQLGRPCSFAIGNAPTDLWKQLRQIVDDSTIGFPLVTAQTTTAAIESTLNLYVLANWSPAAATVASPTELYVFDARTGTYQGRWRIGGASSSGSSVWGENVWGPDVWGPDVWAGGGATPAATVDSGISIDALGTWQDAQGRNVLMIGGSESPGGTSGYLWSLQSVSGIPDNLTTEGGNLLTTESGTILTTEGQQAQWQDGSRTKLVTPTFQATTNRLGFSDDTVWNFDRVTTVLSSDSPINVKVQTSAVANTLEGVPVPVMSQDGTWRPVCGLSGIQGRGASVTVAPTDASTQRVVQSVALRGVPSLAGANEP